MAKIKFPYTLHCPKCKVGLKIKNKAMMGKRIECPKCHFKVDVVPPEEDAYVPYGIEAAPEKEPDPEPTEEELEEKEALRRRERNKKIWGHIKYWAGAVWLILLLVGTILVFQYFTSKGPALQAPELDKPVDPY